MPDEPDEPQGDPDLELEQVFETTDPNLLPVVKSVLESAGIPYHLEGDEAFGLLPLGGGFVNERHQALGVEIHVPRERAEEARALLASAADGTAELPAEDAETLPPESP
jgi:putative signal transducing protein